MFSDTTQLFVRGFSRFALAETGLHGGPVRRRLLSSRGHLRTCEGLFKNPRTRVDTSECGCQADARGICLGFLAGCMSSCFSSSRRNFAHLSQCRCPSLFFVVLHACYQMYDLSLHSEERTWLQCYQERDTHHVTGLRAIAT